MYAIIDYHQIDNTVTGTSAADATTFWTDVAPQFASYTNVLYEPFNEPIDTSAPWATFKPIARDGSTPSAPGRRTTSSSSRRCRGTSGRATRPPARRPERT